MARTIDKSHYADFPKGHLPLIEECFEIYDSDNEINYRGDMVGDGNGIWLHLTNEDDDDEDPKVRTFFYRVQLSPWLMERMLDKLDEYMDNFDEMYEAGFVEIMPPTE